MLRDKYKGNLQTLYNFARDADFLPRYNLFCNIFFLFYVQNE